MQNLEEYFQMLEYNAQFYWDEIAAMHGRDKREIQRYNTSSLTNGTLVKQEPVLEQSVPVP